MAFLVRARAVSAADGLPVRPVFWSDNYFTLRPGESRQLTAHIPDPPRAGVRVVVEAFNDFVH